jgi:SAM-dependent methyltransferase
MWVNVQELRNFYHSKLGIAVQKLISGQLLSIWPSIKDQTILGIGYATPYLNNLEDRSANLFAAMPSCQGAHSWPHSTYNRVSLVDEMHLPLPDQSIDKIILVHILDYKDQCGALLRESWRVLSDGGSLLVIATNRLGVWAHFDKTPFGNVSPYTLHQLKRILEENCFSPQNHSSALYMPPIKRLSNFADFFEKVGHRWLHKFSGVLLVEATKVVYAKTLARPLKWRARAIANPLNYQ